MSPAQERDISLESRIPAIAVSRGIGIGHIVEFRDDEKHVVHYTIGPRDVGAELSRLHDALRQCTFQIEALVEAESNRRSEELAGIFQVQLAMLSDPALVASIETFIQQDFCNAEWAIRLAASAFVEQQQGASDTAFREKRLDLEDVCDRLVSTLTGTTVPDRRIFEGAVILARELRPSTILELKLYKPAGFITERGGWTSHASIVAREFRIPMVSGVRSAKGGPEAGQHAIVDGDSGAAILNPSKSTVEEFANSIARSTRSQPLDSYSKTGAIMRDGTRITVRANADISESYRSARGLGAEGIGLFRSESLIRHPGRVPTEEEQVAAYTEIIAAAGDQGVKIRTFDIGIDRYLPFGGTAEQNPALGLRAIRLSLRENEFFRGQIRSILRAAAVGRVDVVLPMVAGVSELIQTAAIIEEERRRLAESGIEMGPTRLGAMIEVPSAVLTAPEIAKHADFLALGTNDLVQYLLAVDRDNYAVADWYQSLHPAVLRAVQTVIESARSASIPLIVCGEMAASPFYLPLLIGMGVREISLNVNSINQIRLLIENITVDECVALVRAIEPLETSGEIEGQLNLHYRAKWSHLIPHNLLFK